MRRIHFHLYRPSPLLYQMRVLSVLQEDGYVSQNRIAHRVGFAVSSAHNHLHELERQGLITFRKLSPARILYTLTPRGLQRLDHLLGLHLAEAGRLLGVMTQQAIQLLERIASDGVTRIHVIADPTVLEFLRRAAEQSGVEISAQMDTFADHLEDTEHLRPQPEAVVLVGPFTDGGSRQLVEYERLGVPIYRFSPTSP